MRTRGELYENRRGALRDAAPAPERTRRLPGVGAEGATTAGPEPEPESSAAWPKWNALNAANAALVLALAVACCYVCRRLCRRGPKVVEFELARRDSEADQAGDDGNVTVASPTAEREEQPLQQPVQPQEQQQQQQQRQPAEAAEEQRLAAAPKPQPPETALSTLASTARAALHKAPRLSAGAFESAWQQTAQVDVWGATLRGPLPSDAELIALFKQGHVHCLASGEVGGVRKLYLYSQRQSGAGLSLVEVSLAVKSLRATCVFKDQDHSSREEAVSVTFVKSCVRSLAD